MIASYSYGSVRSSSYLLPNVSFIVPPLCDLASFWGFPFQKIFHTWPPGPSMVGP